MTKFNKYIFLILTTLCLLFSNPSFAKDIAVLKYSAIKDEFAWKTFSDFLTQSDIQYDVISEKEVQANASKVIIAPLLQKYDDNLYKNLNSYVANQGKIILIYPGKEASSEALNKYASLLNVNLDVAQLLDKKRSINWTDDKNFPDNDFDVNSDVARIITDVAVKPLAVWGDIEENLPSIILNNKGAYIGWKLGINGNNQFNSNSLKRIIEKANPEIAINPTMDYSQLLTEFNELDRYRNNAFDNIDTKIILSSRPDIVNLQEKLFLSGIYQSLSYDNFKNQNYNLSKQTLDIAKQNALDAYLDTIPSSKTEGRTIWLDRGTVVAIKSQKEMGNLFEKLKNSGINMAYFETINAGYSIYPSKYTEQNPSVEGRDLLKWAIIEARKRGIELHAWAWIFAVGNTLHNPIINKAGNYTGPILDKNFELAMYGQSGNLLPYNQREFWVDPANKKARDLLFSLIEEIVTNYDIDGIQLDYIRYPFQTKTNLMGFDITGRYNFETETGLSLDYLDDIILDIWTKWKTEQINSFVKEASCRVRKIKPGITISAAVFGGARDKRLAQIQQDWETWVDNGWVDILNPMVYSNDSQELLSRAIPVQEYAKGKAFVYPGISLLKINEFNLLDQINALEKKGVLGNTLFAMAHLNNQKINVLTSGPYKYQAAILPNKNITESIKIIAEEFLSDIRALNNYSDNAELNNIAQLTEKFIYSTTNENLNTEQGVKESQLILYEIKTTTNKWLKEEKAQGTPRDIILNKNLERLSSLLIYKK